MFHSRIDPSAVVHGDAPIHSAWCSCHDCASRDPLAFSRARQLLRLQALALILFGATIYGLAIFCAPGIAAAFGWGQ